jgi:hypothetical protein
LEKPTGTADGSPDPESFFLHDLLVRISGKAVNSVQGVHQKMDNGIPIYPPTTERETQRNDLTGFF